MSVLIKDMPRVERPRERLERVGVDGLRDEELLAIVLRTGYHGKSALDVAQALLSHRPLPELLAMPLQMLRKLRGVGESRAATLLAAIELARRAGGNAGSGLPRIQSVADIVAHAAEIRDRKKEYLLALFLNARHHLIAKEIISIGTLTASLAHPREIFVPAVGKSAAAVVLVHNHPSGDPTPSDEDARLTQRILQAGRIMGIELLDHVVVAERGCYSFKNSGGI